MTGLKKIGRTALTAHMTVKKDIGTGSGNSAIKGARIVIVLANMLQIPNAVVHCAVGNIKGVAKYT